MSKFKIVGIMALIAFAMGIILVGNALAGEKFKCRTVWVSTKVERINVDDEKGHAFVLGEMKGIISNMEGKTFGEGWLGWSGYIADISPKIGMTGNGYMTLTDKDGDKIYMKYEFKPPGPHQPWTFFKGTGKFEGVRGKGTFSSVLTADPTLSIANWEGEVELPR
jgi:hypothetical protein